MVKSIPDKLKNHILPFNWNNKIVWQLPAPIQEKPLADFEYLLHLPFWTSIPNCGMMFDISPIEILEEPNRAPHQYERIMNSDINFPMDFLNYKNQPWILDGIHRLAKLYKQNANKVKIRIHSEQIIPSIMEKR